MEQLQTNIHMNIWNFLVHVKRSYNLCQRSNCSVFELQVNTPYLFLKYMTTAIFCYYALPMHNTSIFHISKIVQLMEKRLGSLTMFVVAIQLTIPFEIFIRYV